ncbi:MAG TPA: collagen-like protein, partial [Nitrososphaeraceae archaeon]
MHKSTTTTFGLLMSSLVMLAIMPLFSQQQNSLFSNVMAQGYDNYGDNSHSQYPTEDKRYECQTGPFEGFFVSSVEFCKHIKFDDNKRDSKVGPQGPQGPIGPAGPQGIQGERGFNGTQGLQGAPGQNAIEVTVNN